MADQIFKAYEQDFTKSISAANKKTQLVGRAQNKEDAIADAKTNVLEAERSFKLMEKELMSIPPNLSTQYQQKLKRHKENLNAVKLNLDNENSRKQKTDLMGNPNDQRNALLNGNQILADTGDLLDDTLKVGLETEQIGGSTLNTLKEQRKQIQNIDAGVNDVDQNLNKANSILTTMDRRRLCMKCIMIFMIIVLIITIIAVIGVKFT